MKQLSPEQRELVSVLAIRLGAVRGIRAVVLGGSHARGRAQPGSDIDLGILYSEVAPFSIQSVRELAEDVNDTAGPVVTDFYEWGQWVNGGAWLTIGGQRVDFVYRNLDHVERVIVEAEAGGYELDYAQQPPFGFFSGTYLGEIAVCISLFDPKARIDALKRRVADYPEALRRAVVQDYLWAAEFGLAAFARKFAARSDAYGTAACLARAVNQLVLVLFALNRKYLLNDKTALTEVTEFERAPREFGPRVQKCDDISESKPMLDSRLPDGSRVAAVIPPCSLGGVTLTIRKFNTRHFEMEDLVDAGTLDANLANQLKEQVLARKNILISGGTGTGKTTLLNILGKFILEDDRVLLIEDTAEIQLSLENLARFEARQAQNSLPAVTIRDLLKAALRHRPDRSVLGEVRGGEAFDLLQLLNTGHSGTLSTIHANSAKQGLARFTSCVLQSGVDLPYKAIKTNIADSLNILIQIERRPGRRYVSEVLELNSYNHDADTFDCSVIYNNQGEKV